MDEAKPQDLSVISEIVALVQVPLLIVGARSLQLYQGPISNFRTTLDWDVAIAVDSWMTYEGVRRRLINSGRWAADNRSGDHRLRHIPTATLVDLLPFGQICDPRGVLTLPGSRQQLNMAGFGEAFDCATAITDLERPDLGTIRVATPPAIAALKFISYSDRPAERVRRDLPDIAHILRQYGKSRGQEDRLYEAEFLPLLNEPDFDVSYLGACLCGSEVRRNFTAETLHQIRLVVESLHGPDGIFASITHNIFINSPPEERYYRAATTLEYFRRFLSG